MFPRMNIKSFSFVLAFFVALTQAHEDHSKGAISSDSDGLYYAQRHMANEHHIDTFDLPSFFHLHDLNSDGVWDESEVEAIYGMHHIYAQKISKDEEEHQQKAKFIVKVVLDALDKDKDRLITLAEFEAAGVAKLPGFETLGAEGHHYDVESEFFLHHEEQFHNTPETQTDESYIHPEDLEHFAQHEAIEITEAEREAIFQGISVEEALAQHMIPVASEKPPAEQANTDDQEVSKKFERHLPPEQQDPAVRFREAKAESAAHGEWGSGDEGYKAPKSPSERMRKNVPYKYKFRRNWGDF